MATAKAQTSSVRRWMTGQDTVRLVCRVQGHWWPSDLGTLTGEKHGVYQLQQVCERGCGVTRNVYVYKRDGTPASAASYHYPPGYQFREGGAGMGREARGQVRLELRNRVRLGERPA